MSICPERDMRADMTDDEFWAHVFPRPEGEPDEPDIDEGIGGFAEPCATCGESGPCAYDSEGRPMIHTTPDEDN